MATRKANTGFEQGKFDVPSIPDYVVAELRYDSGLAVARRGGIVAPSAAAEAPARALNEVLAAFEIDRVAPQFDMPERVLATRASAVTGARASVSSDYAQSGFVQIVPKRGRDAKAIARAS